MNDIFKAYASSELGAKIQMGTVSPDRSVIIGKAGVFFLYGGSNDYYEQYNSEEGEDLGQRWADLDVRRRRSVNSSVSMLTMYVPNKATCLPDLYPLLLKNIPTLSYNRMRSLLCKDPAVLFCDELIEASEPEARYHESPWRLVDSHWSEFGCLIAVNAALRRLGLDSLVPVVENCEPTLIWGDLSRKFPGDPILEHRKLQLVHDYGTPIKTFDSGENAAYEAHLGRRVSWLNQSSTINLNLLLIGNSFSGAGTKPTEMTYWFSRVFRKVTFLHSQYLPTDVLDFYNPDLIVFQGLERFLPMLPEDKFTANFIEDRYKNIANK